MMVRDKRMLVVAFGMEGRSTLECPGLRGAVSYADCY